MFPNINKGKKVVQSRRVLPNITNKVKDLVYEGSKDLASPMDMPPDEEESKINKKSTKRSLKSPLGTAKKNSVLSKHSLNKNSKVLLNSASKMSSLSKTKTLNQQSRGGLGLSLTSSGLAEAVEKYKPEQLLRRAASDLGSNSDRDKMSEQRTLTRPNSGDILNEKAQQNATIDLAYAPFLQDELNKWYNGGYGKLKRTALTLGQMKLFHYDQTHAPELMPRPQIEYYFSILQRNGLAEEMSRMELDEIYTKARLTLKHWMIRLLLSKEFKKVDKQYSQEIKKGNRHSLR